MAFNITAGFDTVINNGAALVPIVQPASAYFEEDPDSPTLEFAEQCTVTHKYHGDWATIQTLIVGRGAYLVDSFGYLYRVLSCTIAHEKGNAGSMIIVTESISFNVPPDEFDVEPVEFNPALEKYSAYSVLLDTDLANIQSALELPQETARAEAASRNTYPVGSQAYNLWNALLSKKRRGEDTFYIIGFKVTWSKFYWNTQPLNFGGYIQNPAAIVPATFIRSTLGQIIPASMSCLRFADQQSFARTWYKVTRTWLCGSAGKWDPDIYPTYALQPGVI